MPSDSLLGRPTLGDSAEYCDFVPVNSRYLRTNRELQGGSEGVCTGQGNASEAIGSVWLQGGCEGVRGTLRRRLGACGCQKISYIFKKRGFCWWVQTWHVIIIGPVWDPIL